jgi:hypothetical protein
MNYNKILLLVAYIYFVYLFTESIAINVGKVKNNMLRIYVFSSPRPIRKGIFRKIQNFFRVGSEKANIILMEANSSYFSLSDDDRAIIETIISLNL